MKNHSPWLLGILCLFLSIPSLRAQSLADVLSSIQERHFLLEQRKNATRELDNLRIIDQGFPPAIITFPDEDTYVHWSGIGADYPEDSQLNGLGMRELLVLANQAVREFDEIKREYLNLSTGRIAKAETDHETEFGVLESFSELDLPSVGLITPANYQQKLQQLAIQVHSVRVLSWPVWPRGAVSEFRGTGDPIPSGAPPTTIQKGDGESPLGPQVSKLDVQSGWRDEATMSAGWWYDEFDDGSKYGYSYSQRQIRDLTLALAQNKTNVRVVPGKIQILYRRVYDPLINHQANGYLSELASGQDISSGSTFLLPILQGETTTLTNQDRIIERKLFNDLPGFRIQGQYFDEQWTDPDDRGGIFAPLGLNFDDLGLEGVEPFAGGEDDRQDWIDATKNHSSLYYGFFESGSYSGEWFIYRTDFSSVFVPEFSKGLNRSDNPSMANLTALPKAPVHVRFQPFPDPALLGAINLGRGVNGPSEGYLAIYHPRMIGQTNKNSPRFIPGNGPLLPYYQNGSYPSLSSEIVFLGAKEDFVVVVDGAYQQAPSWNDQLTYDESRQAYLDYFLEYWNRPRLSQVIGRSMIASIEDAADRFSTTVKIYHRDPASALPTDGQPLDLSGMLPFLTYYIDSGSSLTDGFPDHYFNLEVTEERAGVNTEYLFETPGSGNNYPLLQYNLSVKTGGSEIATQVMAIEEGDATTDPSITLLSTENNVTTSRVVLEKEASSDHMISPNRLVTKVTSGEAGSLAETNYVPSARFPTSIVSSLPGAPDSAFSFSSIDGEATGLPLSSSSGAWTTDYVVDGSDLKAISQLNGATYQTSWTQWSDQGATVTVHSPPDGTSSTKTGSGVAVTTYTFDQGNTMGGSVLPWGLVEVDSPGSLDTSISYRLVNSELEIVTETGPQGGSGLSRGTRRETTINSRGFTTQDTTSLASGAAIGGWTSAPGSNPSDWGAPGVITPAVFGAMGSTQLVYDSTVPVVNSSTSPFDLVSSVDTRDSFSRPTQFSWDGSTGSHQYNSGGLGMSSSISINGRTKSSSHTTDLHGKVLAKSSSGNQNFTQTFNYNAAAVSVVNANLTTGAQSTRAFTQSNGALQSSGGNSELDSTGGLIVAGGLLQSSRALADTPGSFLRTYTDAWGRVRKIERPSTANGGGIDTTNIEYSDPGVDEQRVIVKEPSGRWTISETDPFPNSSTLSITRKGIDVDKSGTLGSGDRYTLAEASISGGTLITKVYSSAESANGTWTMQLRSESLKNLANAATSVSLNNGEEYLNTIINFNPIENNVAYQVTTTSSTGLTSTKNYDKRGQLLTSTANGPGLPDTNYTANRHADGSIEDWSFISGTKQSGASYAATGALISLTDPVLGPIAVTHGWADGKEEFGIQALGIDSHWKFDGTESEITGEGVVDQRKTLQHDSTGFTNAIEALEVDQTTSVTSDPSGASNAKNYEAGNGLVVAWNAGGEIDSVTLARGGNVTFKYSQDGARDLTKVTYPGPSGTSSFSETYVTGAHGNLVSIGDRSGDRDLDWINDRLEKVSYSGGLILSGYELDPQFDSFGRRTAVLLKKNGATIHSVNFTRGNGSSHELTGVNSSWMGATYQRDDDNRWITGVNRGNADLSFGRVRAKAGRLTRVGSSVVGAPSFKYQRFDSRGRRKTVLSSQGNWTYKYDSHGQLVSARNSSGPTFSYNVDAIGRRDEYDSSGGMGPSGNAAHVLNQPSGTFSQDADFKLNMLGATGTKFYLSDASITNQQLLPGSWGGYSVEIGPGGAGLDELTLEKDLSQFPYGGWYQWALKGVLENEGDPGAYQDAVSVVEGLNWINPTFGSYRHDADGNRESAPGWNYTFDGRNRLVEAETDGYPGNSNGTRLIFEYDSEGRRVEKEVTTKVSGVETTLTTHFVWDGWDLLYECREDQGGAILLERRYVWGADLSGSMGGAGGAGGLLAYQETKNGTSTVYFPLYDGVGNIVGLADQAGTLLAEYRYGPFGELIEATGPAAADNPWRFATKYEDLETRLIYFGLRYFDPVTGNWLSREPLGEDESLNLYAYCHGDPVNKVDVLGAAEKDILHPNEAGRFKYENGHWLVRVDQLKRAWYQSDWRSDGHRWERAIADDGTQHHRLMGYNLWGMTAEQGPVQTSGSKLWIEASRIAEEKWNLSGHRKAAGVTLAVGSAVLAAPAVLATGGGSTLTTGVANTASRVQSWWLTNPTTSNLLAGEAAILGGGIAGFDGVPMSPGGAIGNNVRRTGGMIGNLNKTRLNPITGIPIDETIRGLAPNNVSRLDYVPTSGTPLVGQSGKTTTILGNYQQDIRHILDETGNIKSLDFGAKPGGFNVLNVPDELYKSPTQFWSQYNQPWLDAALSRGDNILFATKPDWSVLIRRNSAGKAELSGFGKEYLHLRRNGFPSQNK